MERRTTALPIRRLLEMKVRSPRWLLTLRELVRWREWYDTKLPFFLVAMFYAALRVPASGTADLARMAALFGVLCLFAAFGHIVNDYADREADRAAGKPKILARWGEGAARLAVAIPCAGIAGLSAISFDRPTAVLVLLAVLTAAAYSLPPLRLKERGVLGWIAATLAQRTLPMAIIFEAFHRWDGVGAGLCLLSTLIGLRFIIVHQLGDRENDRRSGVRTVATEFGPGRLLALLRGFFALETACLILVAAAMTYRVPPLGAAALAYCAGLALSARRGSALSSASYFAFSGFYAVVWPVVLAAVLALRRPVFLPVVIVTAALVQHHARVGLRRWFLPGRAALFPSPQPVMAGGATVAARRLEPGPAMAPRAASTSARPVAEAIPAGLAALARMQGPDGSFPFFVGERLTPWRPCGRLFSTAYVMLGAGGLLPPENIARAVDFIRRQRRPDGLWEYDPAGKTIPPDADSTACALAALALHGDPAEIARGGDLLRAFWRPGAGPFRTWREPADRAAPERDDAVVNCNVLFALDLVGARATETERSVVVEFVRAAESSQYYCAPSTIAHAARRAGLDLRALSPSAIALPHVRDLLGAAQFLCAMPGPDDALLAALLAAQRPDGAWPIRPWVTGEGDPKQYWGSPAVTTALAIEALRRHTG